MYSKLSLSFQQGKAHCWHGYSQENTIARQLGNMDAKHKIVKYTTEDNIRLASTY